MRGDNPRPRNTFAVAVESRIEESLEWLGIGDFREFLNTLVVFDAIRLHLGHGLVLGLALLRAQNLRWVVQCRLDYRYQVQRIRLRFRLE